MRLHILVIGTLCWLGVLPGAAVVSADGQFSIEIPEAWTPRTDLANRGVVLAAWTPKEGDQDAFQENLMVIRFAKTPEMSLRSLAKDQDDLATTYRPDFTLSDETELTIGGFPALGRICTMTFPEFVSKNRQFIVDVGDAYLVVTASVPIDRFETYDQAMTGVALSLKRVE